jgi:hypothetical protein
MDVIRKLRNLAVAAITLLGFAAVPTLRARAQTASVHPDECCSAGTVCHVCCSGEAWCVQIPALNYYYCGCTPPPPPPG